MLADKRIRKGELVTLGATGPGTLLSTFKDTIESIKSGDIDKNLISSIKFDETEILGNYQSVKSNCQKDFRWIPSLILLNNAAKRVHDKDKQRLILLGSIRVATCDLHVSKTENKFLKSLAKIWKLEELLNDIMSKLPDWERNRTRRLSDLITGYQNKFQTMIDDGSISVRAYERLEESITKEEPNLELYDENKELYKYAESENELLQEKYLKIDQELKSLTKDYKKIKHQLRRLTSEVQDKDSIEILTTEVFTKLQLHENTAEVIDQEYPLKKDVLSTLSKLNFGKTVQSKRVRGTKGWREIAKIKTGNPSLFRNGRIYFKSNKNQDDEYKYKVLVSVKKNESDQRLTIENLRKWH